MKQITYSYFYLHQSQTQIFQRTYRTYVALLQYWMNVEIIDRYLSGMASSKLVLQVILKLSFSSYQTNQQLGIQARFIGKKIGSRMCIASPMQWADIVHIMTKHHKWTNKRKLSMTFFSFWVNKLAHRCLCSIFS